MIVAILASGLVRAFAEKSEQGGRSEGPNSGVRVMDREQRNFG